MSISDERGRVGIILVVALFILHSISSIPLLTTHDTTATHYVKHISCRCLLFVMMSLHALVLCIPIHCSHLALVLAAFYPTILSFDAQYSCNR